MKYYNRTEIRPTSFFFLGMLSRTSTMQVNLEHFYNCKICVVKEWFVKGLGIHFFPLFFLNFSANTIGAGYHTNS